MTIIGMAGAIGSGKSHTQLKYILDIANLKRKMICLNFVPDLNAIYNYATCKGYDWIKYLCVRDGISWIVNAKNMQSLLLPEGVSGLDEAGVYLNSRTFKDTPRELLADLAQSRKFGCDLVYCAQFDEQVDRQMRLLTQYWVHCASISKYDKATRRPSLIWKKIYYFTAENYNLWNMDPKAKASHFKTRYAYAFDYEGGLLTRADKLLFQCFKSFDRLDAVDFRDRVSTLHRCELPTDYYYETVKPSIFPPVRDRRFNFA